jgi:AraC-like DNA-binding protein
MSADHDQRLTGVVVDSLDDDADASLLAQRAYRSRTQFFRVFRALADETPAAMRRRLRLERAAWQLGRTTLPVTGIAFDAQYGSLEAFTRAFRRAFGTSPSLYRRSGVGHYYLPAANAIHFCAPASPGGEETMDLFDLFAGADTFHIRKLLESARTMTPSQLDAPLDHPVRVVPWPMPFRSLRDLLVRLVQTKEIWTAALTGGAAPDIGGEGPEQQTPETLLTRLATADASFTRILGDVRNRNAWGDTFVDTLCEPAETFTFGGMFASVITYNTHMRLLALDAMRRLGVKVDVMGDPMEYEASVTPAR